jgi:hypothetical protein
MVSRVGGRGRAMQTGLRAVPLRASIWQHTADTHAASTANHSAHLLKRDAFVVCWAVRGRADINKVDFARLVLSAEEVDLPQLGEMRHTCAREPATTARLLASSGAMPGMQQLRTSFMHSGQSPSYRRRMAYGEEVDGPEPCSALLASPRTSTPGRRSGLGRSTRLLPCAWEG